MTTPILVTGGTGTLGTHVVPLLRAAGREVRILTRTARDGADGITYAAADLLNDQGIEAALAGIETVVHLAGDAKNDEAATRNLVKAAKATGVRHIVYIGVIGEDTVPLGYFKAKLGAERAILESGIPFTVLRAAQFHDLTLKVVQTMAKLPIVPAPGVFRAQPVETAEVAARLVELALAEPAGRVPDIAGPKVYTLPDLIRTYLHATGKRRLLLPVPVPGKIGRAYRAGENLALEGATHGHRTFEAFLAQAI
ncbi:SDR family oxidoreductase [Nocardia sp. NPDC052566]|uniref:SDR family oxidoreductase n=1 Tax=Nocardia sp. NPDC052566 TaxID=3364330 RepID=UPI0037CAE45D